MKCILSDGERDIITLLNVLWYRDFPITRDRTNEKRVRAMYTAHINGVVKACADLLGFFVLFEHGTRTDAIIRGADNGKRAIAKIEIEWYQPFRREKVNEIEKLSTAALASEADSYIFIGYSDSKRHKENLEAITSQWRADHANLIAMLIVYDIKNGRRDLKEVQTLAMQPAKATLIRTQPALPWDVEDTRWALGTDRAVVDAN